MTAIVNSDYVLIQPDGKIIKENLTEEIQLKKMQESVGGLIEHVNNYQLPDYDVFVNEDGIRLNLELNGIASILLGTEIFGNVLFVRKEFVL